MHQSFSHVTFELNDGSIVAKGDLNMQLELRNFDN